jgi:hypothetical protein
MQYLTKKRRIAVLVGSFVASVRLLLAAAAPSFIEIPRDHQTVGPMLFFTNHTAYNVLVGQKTEATTFPDNEHLHKMLWQVAPADSIIPLGRLNRDQDAIELVYQFYGSFWGTDDQVPIVLEYPEKMPLLFNVTLSAKNWSLLGGSRYHVVYTTDMPHLASLQHVFPRARSLISSYASEDEIARVFYRQAENPDVAYLFLNTQNLRTDEVKGYLKTMLPVVKHILNEAVASGYWLMPAPSTQSAGVSASAWLFMRTNYILNKAYATLRALCDA